MRISLSDLAEFENRRTLLREELARMYALMEGECDEEELELINEQIDSIENELDMLERELDS